MNKKGFTLIEIIVVIVILGVLATLALPRLTAQIAASESAEAMQFFGVIKRAAISCYDGVGSFANCKTQGQLGITIPASKFTYTTSNPVAANTFIRVQANSAAGNYIQMTVQNTGVTQFAALATSPYVGIVNKTNSTTSLVASLATGF